MSGIGMLAIGLGLAVAPTGAARAAEPLPPLVTTLQTVTDAAADVLNTDNASAFEQPRADITGASLEYAPGWIRMRVQTKQPTDPLKDPAWSDKSDAEWALDTNGDGKPEYTVEFATDQGELYGAVFDVNKPEDKSLCDADSASFSPQDGYTLVLNPECIGKPKTLAYSVAMFFDTNPKDEKAPMATDRVPDQGFKEVAAPVQPGETPPPAPSAPAAGSPTAPAQAPSGAGGAPGPAAKPGAAPAPRTAASAPAIPSTAAPLPDVAGAPAPSAQAPGSPLARTGSPSTTRALLGFGIMLVGAGMLVMTRPAVRVHRAV